MTGATDLINHRNVAFIIKKRRSKITFQGSIRKLDETPTAPSRGIPCVTVTETSRFSLQTDSVSDVRLNHGITGI